MAGFGSIFADTRIPFFVLVYLYLYAAVLLHSYTVVRHHGAIIRLVLLSSDEPLLSQQAAKAGEED